MGTTSTDDATVLPSSTAAAAASAPAPSTDGEDDLGYEVLEPDSDIDLGDADRDSPRPFGKFVLRTGSSYLMCTFTGSV